MANSSLYQYASKYAQKAYEQDKAGNYKAAHQNYLKAAEVLQQLISFTSNPQLKNMYYVKAKEYLARAKELKDQGLQPVEYGGKRINIGQYTANFEDSIIEGFCLDEQFFNPKTLTNEVIVANNAMKQQYGTDVESVDIFDFGYCISTHKAQGSGFDNVIVFEEQSSIWDQVKWNYTAVTRAIKKLVFIS